MDPSKIQKKTGIQTITRRKKELNEEGLQYVSGFLCYEGIINCS